MEEDDKKVLNEMITSNDDWLTFLAKQNRINSEKKKKSEFEFAIEDKLDVSNYSEIVKDPPIKFNFELDIFQKRAIMRLESNESVLVCAHTSAGKTVVAEYAIALSLFRYATKAIYTSPIKALSNQKYREFKQKGFHVGLITGDVQIDPDAPCLIVTTEILRSMLYRGSDVIRFVEWVIFDEVHYLNDPDRGVVWEESIILLPPQVNLVMLSATVPNAFEFADWIGRTKEKKVYVISTPKRPVPLEHYVYTAGDMFKVVDSESTFLGEGYKRAKAALKTKRAKSLAKFQPTSSISSKVNPQNPNQSKVVKFKGKGKGKSHQMDSQINPLAQQTVDQRMRSEQSVWHHLISMLQDKAMLPVVVFSFSKRKCEQCAFGFTSLDLAPSKEEKSAIHLFIKNSLENVLGPDENLPQIQAMTEILNRGIGIHHSGLLPIMKEIVEILFAQGLVKVLFATETFAMGVNMPARTAIFNGLQKHDGTSFRDLRSGEYIQMSGRAGRRGIDTVGTVLLNCSDELPDVSFLSGLILGNPTRLESQFRLTYNMILNLFVLEDLKVEDMLKSSFNEFYVQRLVPEQRRIIAIGNAHISSLPPLTCLLDPHSKPSPIEEYYPLWANHDQYSRYLTHVLLSSRHASRALIPGRVLVISSPPDYPHNLAVLLQSKDDRELGKSFDLLVLFDKCDQVSSPSAFLPPLGTGSDHVVLNVNSEQIFRVCSAKLKLGSPNEMRNLFAGQNSGISATIAGKLRTFLAGNERDGPPEIHFVRELKFREVDVVESFREKEGLEKRMKSSKCHNCPHLKQQLEQKRKGDQVEQAVSALNYAFSEANLQLMPEFQNRLHVLQNLHYLEGDSITKKGRVARELNTVSSELILAEMLFQDFFGPLNPQEAVALISCFIFDEKSESEQHLSETLQTAIDQVLFLCTQIAELQTEMGIHTIPEDLHELFNTGLVQVVYEWASGQPFSEVVDLTDIQEGSIVRSITRLGESCREVASAAQIIGDTALFEKMEQAQQMIKRDMICISSLYVRL